MNLEQLKKLPKIELHCHLDGSLSRGFMEKRLGRPVSHEEVAVSPDCRSLNEYLEKFALPGQCLMDEEGLELAGLDVLEQMSRENVIYAEIRFAPLLSVTEKMDAGQAIAALLRGIEAGKEKYGVSAQVIACLMRHHSPEQNLSALDAAEPFLGKGVCAVDLAGAEALYPMAQFTEIFGEAKTRGIPFTIHAGECGSEENILDAVRAGAGRIGHGIAMKGSPATQQLIRTRGIGIEMCPISNLQTKSVKGPEEYPLREFLDAGLPVTVNTDNRTVSDTTLTKELEFIQKTYKVGDEEIVKLMKNAARAAFLGDDEKERLLTRI